MKAYQKIMVGIDGSEPSRWALARGVELAQHYKAQLLLVTIEDDARFVPLVTGKIGQLPTPPAVSGVHDQIQMVMDKAVTYAQERGVTVTSKVYYGDAKVELAQRIPAQEHVDLIVLGATGLNRLEQMIVGSNSKYVMQHAPCDVMLVREAQAFE